MRGNVQMPYDVFAFKLHVHRPRIEVDLASIHARDDALLRAQPASSPELCLKYDLFLSITSFPLIMTVLLPSVVSVVIPVFG